MFTRFLLVTSEHKHWRDFHSWIDINREIVLCKLGGEKAGCSVTEACECCELCPILSTITSLHSCEHAGQSEINVLSLGNTQELVSFIVLSSVDNCFAAVLQNDKTMSLWQMVRTHVQEGLMTGCGIASPRVFLSRTSSQAFCLALLSKCC